MIPTSSVVVAGPICKRRWAAWAVALGSAGNFGWVHGGATLAGRGAGQRVAHNVGEPQKYLRCHQGDAVVAVYPHRFVNASSDDAAVAQLIKRCRDVVLARANCVEVQIGDVTCAGGIDFGFVHRKAGGGDAANAVVFEEVERAGSFGVADAAIRFADFEYCVRAEFASRGSSVATAQDHALGSKAVFGCCDRDWIEARWRPIERADVTLRCPHTVGTFGLFEVYARQPPAAALWKAAAAIIVAQRVQRRRARQRVGFACAAVVVRQTAGCVFDIREVVSWAISTSRNAKRCEQQGGNE